MSDQLGPNVENVMKVEFTKEWCMNMAKKGGSRGCAAEREACARVCESYGGALNSTAQAFARMIRARVPE